MHLTGISALLWKVIPQQNSIDVQTHVLWLKVSHPRSCPQHIVQDDTSCHNTHRHPWLLFIIDCITRNLLANIPEAFLTTLNTADPVIEDAHIQVHASSGEEFHQPCSWWEGVITENELVDFGLFIDKGLFWGEANGVVFYLLP